MTKANNLLFNCYSFDTEVMTDTGWRLFKDVDVSKDKIMSLNPKINEIEMIKAVDCRCQPLLNKIFYYHSHNMDFCVTGNHKMLAYDRDGKYKEVTAEQIKKSYLLPISGFNWKGRDEQYFTIPEVTQLEQYSRKEIVIPAKKIKMEDWLEFFGFWLADGCCRDHINSLGKRDYTVSIKQNESNEEYVLNLISKIGFKTEISKRKDRNNNYNIYSKQLWSFLWQFGRSQNKYIPREILSLDKKYLKCLFDGYKNGDSHANGDGINLSSVSKTLMENMQELILKVFGQITKVRTINAKYKNEPYIYYMLTFVDHTNKTRMSKYGIPDLIDYNENMYYLTLEENFAILTRHNGVIGWC